MVMPDLAHNNDLPSNVGILRRPASVTNSGTKIFGFGGRILLTAILAITLWQNYYDIEGVMAGESLALYVYNGPIAAKLAKDVFNCVLLLVILYHALATRTNPLSAPALALFVVVVCMAAMSALVNGPMMAAFGLRWILPMFIFMLMGSWARTIDTRWATIVLFSGMLICLAAQFYQMLFMPSVFGELPFGIPARTPGIFIAPNSTALFACSAAACIMVFNVSNRAVSVSAASLALLIGFACQSGVGIIVAMVLLLRLTMYRLSYWVWVFAGVLVIGVFPYLDSLTGRAGYVENSGGGRVDVLLKIVMEAGLGVTNFGIYTNSANLASQSPELMTAVDSLLASWVGNFGVLAIPAALIVYWFVKSRMPMADWNRAFPCLIVFALFSFTSIIFEAFPMNLLLCFGIWNSVKVRDLMRR